MAMSPRQMNCQELIGCELPACVVGIGLIQAVGREGLEASGGQGLLRRGCGEERGIEGCDESVLLRMGVDGMKEEGVGMDVTVRRIACLGMKQDGVLVDSELRGGSLQLMGAGTAPKH